MPGAPDLFVALKGADGSTGIFFELKSETGTLKAHQREAHERLRAQAQASTTALQAVEPAAAPTAMSVAVPMAMAVAAPPLVVVHAPQLRINDEDWESHPRASAVTSVGLVRSSQPL